MDKECFCFYAIRPPRQTPASVTQEHAVIKIQLTD